MHGEGLKSRWPAWSLACVAALLGHNVAQGALLSGFEAGLAGWDVVGDVSVQGSALGLQPTEGASAAFITTLCDRNQSPAQGRPCDVSPNEHPLSGVSSVSQDVARAFLGLPSDTGGFYGAMPQVEYFAGAGESGVIKFSFFAARSGVLSFDWNKFGEAGDSAYFSLWSGTTGADPRLNDWLYTYADRASLAPSPVDLCARYYDVAPSSDCYGLADSVNLETGWSTRSIAVSATGWYTIGFALAEVAEGSVPSALAIDNLRFDVPEPSTLSMTLAAVALTLALVSAGRARSVGPTGADPRSSR